ncbi:hypothetical protein IWQ62_005389 [Dispira parvispora]|uniref:RPA-interacting protein C-terminal domain-containing protein n=1 Tax=Dispira parvispora TaxID=1520584 RepID=A0A9W8AIX0_9FUNG|nr:hypothetical protein IWQ62_005389 [Dispira parvispora]
MTQYPAPSNHTAPQGPLTSAPSSPHRSRGVFRHALPAAVSPLRTGRTWKQRLKQQCLERVRHARQEHLNRRRTAGTPSSKYHSSDDISEDDESAKSDHPISLENSDAWVHTLLTNEWQKLENELQGEWQREAKNGTLVDPLSIDADFLEELEQELRREAQQPVTLSEEREYQALREFEQADIDSAVEHLLFGNQSMSGNIRWSPHCPRCQGALLDTATDGSQGCPQCGLVMSRTTVEQMEAIHGQHQTLGCVTGTLAVTLEPSVGYVVMCNQCDYCQVCSI